MRRVPPSVQMQQALIQDFRGGLTGYPLRQFVRHPTEFPVQVGIEEQADVFSGRDHYDANPGAQPGYRNGHNDRMVKTEVGALHLRSAKERQMVTPLSLEPHDDLRDMNPELRAPGRRAYVRGLSNRANEDLHIDASGGSLYLSVAKLQAGFETWRTRDLSDLKLFYLFLDCQFHATWDGSREKQGFSGAHALLSEFASRRLDELPLQHTCRATKSRQQI